MSTKYSEIKQIIITIKKSILHGSLLGHQRLLLNRCGVGNRGARLVWGESHSLPLNVKTHMCARMYTRMCSHLHVEQFWAAKWRTVASQQSTSIHDMHPQQILNIYFSLLLCLRLSVLFTYIRLVVSSYMYTILVF